MDRIGVCGIICRVLESLLSKEILPCSLIFCQILPWQPSEAWDSRVYQVPVHLRPILTQFSNLISSTHAILKQSHTCFLEHTIIFLVERVPFNWSVLYIERKPGSLYQCLKVMDSWDLILILLLTSVVTFGYINFRRPPFSCIKTGIITVHIPTTVGMDENSFSSQPISVL